MTGIDTSFRYLLARSAILPALFLVTGVYASASPRLPVPAESFLNYHAASVNELSQEVTLDPQVRARLANHFHLSEAQLVAYIHRNLVLRHLSKSGVYRVACVRRDGSEYWIESRLPAGTPVFASRATGQPILKLACGNPMVSALPAGMIENSRIAPPQTASTPAMLADATLDTPPVLSMLDGTESTLLSPDAMLAPPVVEVSPSIQFLGRSPLGSIFPALLGAGAAVAVFGHGTPNTNVPAAVPETSTVTSFGILMLGGSLLFILRRKTPAQTS